MENFDETAFIANISNIFVKTYTAVMLDKMSEVEHFMSDEVYSKFVNNVEDLKQKNQRQMYDELNVKSCHLDGIDEVGENYVAKVTLVARYLDYILDLNEHKIISGQDNYRAVDTYSLEFTKSKDAKKRGIITKCPTCGQSLETNNSGLCKFCRTTFKQEDYDWVMTKIEKVNHDFE
ncbi:MAG: TIM44-like domain-containing protein [Candidatus Saccharibacteria bacterium]|nr:TIM44-like domain-containing protein [Candidatus Saccharibacteria bacterium]